jgi:large subunit ribosomal protein L5
MNKMREVGIEKVVVNISVGEAGEKVVKAAKILEMLTGQKPMELTAKATIKDWGIRRGMRMAVKVTLRREKALEFLKKAFWTKNNRVAAYSFDEEGNLSVGIGDYTHFEHMKYDPDIGECGMDVSILLRRKGSRIAKRHKQKSKIPRSHRVTRNEGIEFMKQKFGLEVVE